MTNVIGNKNSIFSIHGTTDPDKVLEAIFYMSGKDDIDIDKLNRESEKGGIYILNNGKILEEFDDSAEARARYKLVPTGLKQKYTEYPLFASFIKLNGMWEGAFIGTGTQLFKMYKDHYGGGPSRFSTDGDTTFSGINRTLDIQGFGLTDVLNKDTRSYTEIAESAKTETDNDMLVYKSTDKAEDNISSLEKAIQKCMSAEPKNNSSKVARLTKNQRKAARLKQNLEKMRQNEEKKKKALEEKEKQRLNEEEHELEKEDTDKFEFNWLEISAIESCNEFFEDSVTREMNEKIKNFVTDDSDDTYIEDFEEETDISPLVQSKEKDKAEETREEKEAGQSEVKKEHIEEEAETEEEKKSTLENYDSYTISNLRIIQSIDHDRYNSESAEKNKFSSQLKADLIQDIYERLLMKEHWMANKNKDRLGFYLRAMFIAMEYNREMSGNPSRGNGYNFNEDKSKCVMNTGLIDVYGNYIYIIDNTPYIPDFDNKRLSILNNKAGLLNMGFSIQNVKKLPDPLIFTEDNSQLLFKADITDFDFEDTMHLYHIIEERRYRFPEKYRKESTKALCDRLKDAVEQAVKIQKTDYRYILPKYDFYRHDIQFLIPFHLDTKLDEAPELAIVVGENRGILSVYTVLFTDDAYDDARLLCRPSSDWIKIRR